LLLATRRKNRTSRASIKRTQKTTTGNYNKINWR